MTGQHIVKVKAPRSGSERLELVLDPNWNVTPDTRDEVEEDDFPYPELTQSSSRHSYHSESTAETDNRSFSRVSRTYSLESDGSLSRTDFESDAYKEMERRGVVYADGMGSIDEEDEMNYKDVEEENREQEVVEDVDENEYYTDDADVQAAVGSTASNSYSYEDDDMQYHVNDDACVIKDVGSPDSYDESPEEQLMLSATSGTFDESDVYDEVYEDQSRAETPANKSFRRGVSFDEESLSKQESTRNQERSKTPIRRMPSEDTSVASVGYRVVQTVKQHNLPSVQTNITPVHLKARAASPSILREPKYASNASVSSPPGEQENTPRHSKQMQAPAPMFSPRATNRKTINDSNRSGGSSGQESATSLPETMSVHSRSSNSPVRRPRDQISMQPLMTNQQQQRKQQLQQQRERLRRQIEEEKRERLRQQQEEEEEERLRQEEEEQEFLRLRHEEQRRLELEQEQYREPLQSIDPAEDDDRNLWSKNNDTFPKLLRSPSGLSRFSEGMRSNRSTAALDGFAIEMPKKPKLSWFIKSKKGNDNITKTANEIIRPKSKTKLMKKFFGKKKKNIQQEIGHDDSERAAKHPLSAKDPDPEHVEAPLPSILTSSRPMRVHTAARDRDEESIDQSTVSYNSRQSIRSHNSRHSMGSYRSTNSNRARPRPKSSYQQTTKSPPENLNSNPWAGNVTNAKTETSNKIVIHESVNGNGSIPTDSSPDGAYNLDGAGMPSFKWWTWSQPDETGQQQQDSRYCAMMCVFPPAAVDE